MIRKKTRESMGGQVESLMLRVRNDEARRSKQLHHRDEFRSGISERRIQPQGQSFTFHSSTISYECKEADSSTMQATHRISRGLHIIRAILSLENSDWVGRRLLSRLCTTLMKIEQSWNGSAGKHMPGSSEHTMNSHGKYDPLAVVIATAKLSLTQLPSTSSSLRPIFRRFPVVNRALRCSLRGIGSTTFRCAAGGGGPEKKAPARLSQFQLLLEEAEERALSAGNEPTPRITLDHVTVSFARSGGPGGQNVNKVNTKVDMRFNVKNAYWLSDRIRERIMQMEKNRINKDGEIVISSTKTRTQKGNIDDALGKLQEIIEAAAYVPPPPSEEQKKKIAKIAAIGEQKRLKSKKVLSDKKAFRRSRDSWD
ncbi:hypothetical protein MLD38_020902 [Melastoma candidum]|uniref:Uncharacterized protein n=1 Tax=Melastoma candidum TaxID=119954 RepID=A0ACB9QHD6_9MYRT|nr:hypothetical protein MLD38_020902 [Melastoma candidum]